MEIVHGSGSLPLDGPSAVTIGVFDGVHRGHRAVIARTVETAGELGARPVVVTFDRHPLETLSPGKTPKLLTTLRRKAGLIEELGAGALFVLEFTEEVSRWSPEEFVDRILVRGLRARHVVIGANFTFGHKAAGNLESLRDMGGAAGFGVEGMGLLAMEGRPVSSTSIREALVEGDLSWPTEALGRRYVVDGQVVPGAGRGKSLGFPTANLRVPDGILLPGGGVYAGRAEVGGRWWTAAVNIGTNPTFGEEPLHLEAHLLDHGGDLTGQVMAVELWERLRDEVRFESPEALAEQIGRDVEMTRRAVS